MSDDIDDRVRVDIPESDDPDRRVVTAQFINSMKT